MANKKNKKISLEMIFGLISIFILNEINKYKFKILKKQEILK